MKLASDPIDTLRGIYQFLGERFYEDHNPGHVEQVTMEDDTVHYFGPGLHAIRTKIEPQEPQWPNVLGSDVAKHFESLSRFWDVLRGRGAIPDERHF